ncbi:proton channel OtopLc isoform X2 [Parasteatoda tepidariorum]|uniref:proton channel OtopLc isoform X2 n=1 Tax=Parasteatoda tepidariorum TaxID=114398 RepID=UPI001C71D24C|nr:proton channel OtopLc-like isoform X2 [Parasteatoda tepidariorum]
MQNLRQVQFRMRSLSSQSKDDGSIEQPMSMAASLMPRSMSLNSLNDDASCKIPSNQGCGEIRRNIPSRISEDSGLGALNSSLSKRAPSLHLDMGIVSRTSSFAGSMNTLPTTPTLGRKDGFVFFREISTENDSLVIMLSAVYAKLLVVMGISFPLAEVISHKIPASYYEGFYLYLYLGCIVFLIYVYLFLLRSESSNNKAQSFFKQVMKRVGSVANSIGGLDRIGNGGGSNKPRFSDASHCGSFYLRLGAVAFGIGSMIYSGLEFGQFFELETNSHCYNILYALTPSSRMAFTFIQLYFIFLNSRMAISKYRTLARFGLMHMIATNLCVWLHVLVQETKHEILTLITPNSTNLIPAFVLEAQQTENIHLEQDYISPIADDFSEIVNTTHGAHQRHKRTIDMHGIYISHGCRRLNIMGELVQNASPFLFPCTIEYSLICAAILYVMWKNIGQFRQISTNADTASLNHAVIHGSRQRHYYQVDCAKANKGLFTGIMVLVLSIICLIIFFVLINKPQYKYLAILEAHIAELALYLLTTLAVVIALVQVRELKYNPHQIMELDSILLVVAQSGLYLFTMFSVIGGHFTIDQNTILVLLTALVCLIQGTFQTIFILDASKRCAGNSDQAHRKPGREMVTFLLVCNFAMWAINTLETRRADSNPVQMEFYGFWAWTIITHVTTPLTIFFRFHSTVCLCDIWKRTYKVKSEYI